MGDLAFFDGRRKDLARRSFGTDSLFMYGHSPVCRCFGNCAAYCARMSSIGVDSDWLISWSILARRSSCKPHCGIRARSDFKYRTVEARTSSAARASCSSLPPRCRRRSSWDWRGSRLRMNRWEMNAGWIDVEMEIVPDLGFEPGSRASAWQGRGVGLTLEIH